MNQDSLRPLFAGFALLLTALLVSCENNIARLWDRDPGSGGGDGDATLIEVVAVGGISKDGRPRVVEAFPEGQAWPLTVPVVVVFDESVAPASVTPDEGTPRVFIRPESGGAATPTVPGIGAGAAIQSDVVYLLGDTVVVLRPLQPLSADTTYEVVVDPELRDADGVPKGGSEPEVVATFTPNQGETLQDGKVVTILPRDRERLATRETPVWAIFDRPALADTVDEATFRVSGPGGVAVAGTVRTPLTLAEVEDTRFARFLVNGDSFAGRAEFEVRLEDTIGFGTEGGVLSSPRGGFVSRFETVAPTSPLALRVGSETPGFPNKVNRQNLADLLIDVDVDAGAVAGDRVLVRIYGGEPRTDAEGDLAFVEAQADLMVDGPTTVSVSFGSQLGTVDALRFEEGDLALIARVEGGGVSGYTSSDPADPPLIDVTPPTVRGLAPTLPADATAIVTDQEAIAVFGQANERLGAGELTVAGTTVQMFGASIDGGFVFPPVSLGVREQPASYMLTVTDSSGNVSPDVMTGMVYQRGLVAGTAAGSITVEAYDEATFAPVAGATVIIDPDVPVSPPGAGRQMATTGADGRAMVSGLPAGSNTVTIVADGYDLVTLLATPGALCSLPLRPATGATAKLSGQLQFAPSPGRTALVSTNAFDDPTVEALATTVAAPTDFGPVLVRPGRPLVLTGFAGTIEPVALPAFQFWACQMCGFDGQTASAPLAPLEPDETSQVPLLIAIPEEGTAKDLAAGYDVDFASSVGFGTPERPTVRVMASLGGLSGMSLFGVGRASPGMGEVFRIDASYSLPIVFGLARFAPLLWVSAQTQDAEGNLVRHRQLIADTGFGITLPTVVPPGVPTVETPAGPSSGAPLVRYADVLDAAPLTGGFGVTTITATDPDGRAWRVFRHDTDGAGATAELQFPVMPAMVTGLATGAWTVVAENDLCFTLTQNASGWLIEERKHQQVTYARALGVAVTVQ